MALEKISMAPVDTAITPYDKTTTSSRSNLRSPAGGRPAVKRPTVMWMHGAQAAVVAVNPKTGRVHVKRGAAHDVGKAINTGCLQQIEGAPSSWDWATRDGE